MSKVEDKDCMDQALIAGQQAYAAGIGDKASIYYMNVVYAICEGYSMEDVNMWLWIRINMIGWGNSV